jgi:hypothetical protein
MILSTETKPSYVKTQRPDQNKKYTLCDSINHSPGLLYGDRYIESPQSVNELRYLLDNYKVNYSEWGQNSSKTLEDLFQEISLEILKFSKNLDNELHRNVSIVRITVHGQINKKTYKLVETAQILLSKDNNISMPDEISIQTILPNNPIFVNQRCRYRGLDTVNKKVPRGESVPKIARQALMDELKLDPSYVENSLYFTTGLTETFLEADIDNHSFPGLGTIYTFYHYNLTLDSYNTNPNGYIDWRSRMVTFFKWVEL